MNEESLKKGMMKLWEITFKDSPEYVRLVFDTYFDIRHVAYEEREGRIVAALLAVPYEFERNGRRIRAAYLCGLATEPAYRRQGIMKRLMDDVLVRLREEGYTLAFLIPASETLVRYYQIMGWSTAIYRVRENFTELHDFTAALEKPETASKTIVTRIEYLKADGSSDENIKISNLVKNYLDRVVLPKNMAMLRHSLKDMEAVVKENALSGGQLWLARNEEGETVGVAFVMPSSIEKNVLEIRLVIGDDEDVERVMLQKVLEGNPGFSLSVFRFPEEVKRKVLWQETYAGTDPDAPTAGAVGVAERVYDVSHNAEIYGMAKILVEDEILKFAGVDPEDSKYKILKSNPRDLQGVLFRRPDSSPLIEEAFELPRLGLNMALLLD